MEGKLTARTAIITPAARGWNVAHPGVGVENVASLEAAAELARPEHLIHLALPSGAVVVERLKLPSTDPQELAGMVDLQLEKSLPYGPEEVTSAMEIIRQQEGESTVLALAINNDQIETLCQPLHTEGRVPEKITMFATHVAAGCPADKLTFAVYCEQEKFIVIISDQGKLAFMETIDAETPARVLEELPHMLLSAELDGVPTSFTAVRVDNDCVSLRAELSNFLGVPAEIIAVEKPLPEPSSNLLPPSWRLEREQIDRREARKKRLIAAAVLYVFLILAALVYLMVLRRQVDKLAGQLRERQPQIDLIQVRLARWNALAPAIDPSRYAVEILNQIEKSRPEEGVRFTQFDQSRDQFLIEIEAPSASLAIDFAERLKKNPELTGFTFESSPPTILPNEHAQMRISAKL